MSFRIRFPEPGPENHNKKRCVSSHLFLPFVAAALPAIFHERACELFKTPFLSKERNGVSRMRASNARPYKAGFHLSAPTGMDHMARLRADEGIGPYNGSLELVPCEAMFCTTEPASPRAAYHAGPRSRRIGGASSFKHRANLVRSKLPAVSEGFRGAFP